MPHPQPHPRPRLHRPSHPSHLRALSTLRLTPTTRTHLTNASFVAAAAIAIFTVALGMTRLPCPARPPSANGGQKMLGLEEDAKGWTRAEKGKAPSKRRWLDDPVVPGVPMRTFVAGQGRGDKVVEGGSAIEAVVVAKGKVGGGRVEGRTRSEVEGRDGWREWARKLGT